MPLGLEEAGGGSFLWCGVMRGGGVRGRGEGCAATLGRGFGGGVADAGAGAGADADAGAGADASAVASAVALGVGVAAAAKFAARRPSHTFVPPPATASKRSHGQIDRCLGMRIDSSMPYWLRTMSASSISIAAADGCGPTTVAARANRPSFCVRAPSSSERARRTSSRISAAVA